MSETATAMQAPGVKEELKKRPYVVVFVVLAAVTFLDRPYRRLVQDLPVRYVGFTVPDEFFVGYGFDVDERYRNLPDLHVLRSET